MKQPAGAPGSQPAFSLYWSRPTAEILGELGGEPDGLNAAEAQARLERWGPNSLAPRRQATALAAFLRQFRSPWC